MVPPSEICRHFEEDLSALLDQELPAEREAELRAHLDACPSCRRQLERLCDADLALASLPVPGPATDLPARMRARLAAEGAAPARQAAAPRRAAPARRQRPARVLAWASLAASLLLAATFLLRSTEPSTQAPRVARESAPPAGEGSRVAPPPTGTPQEPLVARAPAAAGSREQPAARRPPAPRAPDAGTALVAEAPVAPEPATAPLEGLADEDLALLLSLDELEDYDVVANLDLLERVVAKGPRPGAG
jgi:anti-sigma factor RsiW